MECPRWASRCLRCWCLAPWCRGRARLVVLAEDEEQAELAEVMLRPSSDEVGSWPEAGWREALAELRESSTLSSGASLPDAPAGHSAPSRAEAPSRGIQHSSGAVATNGVAWASGRQNARGVYNPWINANEVQNLRRLPARQSLPAAHAGQEVGPAAHEDFEFLDEDDLEDIQAELQQETGPDMQARFFGVDLHEAEQGVQVNGPGGAYTPMEAAVLMSMLPHEKWSFQYIRDEDNGEGDSECRVCLDDLAAEDEIVRLPCMHYAHTRCMETWLIRFPTCPVCRTDAREALGLTEL